VKHEDFAAQLDAYVDGELVGNEARDMERHARECATCAQAHERQLALRSAIRERLPALQALDRKLSSWPRLFGSRCLVGLSKR